MYITKEDLDRRLKKTELSIIEKTRKPRGEESRLNNDERALIGILAEGSTQTEVADLMGVSQTTVSNVSRGLVAPSSGVNEELKEKLASGKEEVAVNELARREAIQNQLITNLAAALGQVANNLHDTDATEASKIATDMSKILDRVTGDREERKGNKTAIIINVPSMKEEKHYQTITV